MLSLGVADVAMGVMGVRGLWSIGNWCYQCV